MSALGTANAVLAKQPYPCDLYVGDIEQLLPHRGDILFARHVRLLGPEHYQGFISWGFSSMGIAGHFPSLSIIPGVYLIEAASQIAGVGILVAVGEKNSASDDNIGVLASVRRCMFKRPVFPGQEVVFDLNAKHASGAVALVTGTVSAEGHEVASLDFALARVSRSRIYDLAKPC